MVSEPLAESKLSSRCQTTSNFHHFRLRAEAAIDSYPSVVTALLPSLSASFLPLHFFFLFSHPWKPETYSSGKAWSTSAIESEKSDCQRTGQSGSATAASGLNRQKAATALITSRSTTTTPNSPRRQPWPRQTRLGSRLSIKAGDPKPDLLLLLHGVIANRGPPPATAARARPNQRCRGPNSLLFSSVPTRFRPNLVLLTCCRLPLPTLLLSPRASHAAT
ncbi:hypothetical protein BHE74_00047358 [Ensete ventricosum]|nr:hypothetical protein BHE74_00047358 [Ensete ventricosum]